MAAMRLLVKESHVSDREKELLQQGLDTVESVWGHADGANMLAEAVRPYRGIIMWRSFVYGAAHAGEDRVKQAVSEFKDLDGKFADNVILQSKNGPLDFQPREPYAPMMRALNLPIIPDRIRHVKNRQASRPA